MKLKGFDHLVLTVTDVAATVCFYTQVLGMEAVVEGSRHELHFGTQKINLHSRPGEFLPAAENLVSGSADFCLIANGPMHSMVESISRFVVIEEGPVRRKGACGSITSIYLRDPDRNLVEVCVYD